MLIKVDASGLEWRVAVMLSQDKTGIQEILDGADAHNLNKEHFGLPDRHTAKIYLFRTIYRGSGWSFANDPAFQHVSKSQEYWEGINEAFYKKYADLDATHKRWAKLVAERKPIVSPFGRFWLVEPKVSKWGGSSQIPWTTLSNYPVQGTGHDIVSLARIEIHNKLLQNKMETRLISTVHDDIISDAPNDEVNDVARIMYAAFDKVPEMVMTRYKYDTAIPFKGEVKIGPNMADMHDLKLEDLQ